MRKNKRIIRLKKSIARIEKEGRSWREQLKSHINLGSKKIIIEAIESKINKNTIILTNSLRNLKAIWK